MSRQAYPEYKPSDVEWLGEIPEHWKVRPLKYAAFFINGAAFKPSDWQDNGVPIIRIENLNGGEDFNYSSEQLPAKYYVQKGDLLFGWSGNRGTSFGPFLWWREGLHYLNQHIFRFTGFSCDKLWLYWTLKAVTFYVEKQAHGIIGLVHITKGDLGVIKIPVVPPTEQITITAFLDRETARIDTLIEKKQRQIELLLEKRSALISHAVTKGLDPNAKMKDSGIEWLGEIPAHWEVKRVKRLGAIRYGLGEPPEYVDDGLPFIRATDIKRGKIDLDDVKKVSRDDIPWSRRPLLNLHEILVVRSGAYTGDSAIVTENIAGCIAGYDMVLTINKGYAPFIAWVLLSKYMLHGQIYLERLRAAQPHLNAEELGSFVILVPPFEEQREISGFLGRETARIDVLIGKVRESINLLREYRTALISAAVTGKVDVRREVA